MRESHNDNMDIAGQAPMMKTISRILIAHPRFPPLADDYADAFGKAGVQAKTFIIEDHVHWAYRYVFRRINKLARTLRLVPRGTDLFRKHRLGEVDHLATRPSEEAQPISPMSRFAFMAKEPKSSSCGNQQSRRQAGGSSKTTTGPSWKRPRATLTATLRSHPLSSKRFSRTAVRLTICLTAPIFVSIIRLPAVRKRSTWYFSAPGVRGAIRSLPAHSR